MWLTLTNTEVDEVNVNEVNVNVPEGHAVDQGVELPKGWSGAMLHLWAEWGPPSPPFSLPEMRLLKDTEVIALNRLKAPKQIDEIAVCWNLAARRPK